MPVGVSGWSLLGFILAQLGFVIVFDVLQEIFTVDYFEVIDIVIVSVRYLFGITLLFG